MTVRYLQYLLFSPISFFLSLYRCKRIHFTVVFSREQKKYIILKSPSSNFNQPISVWPSPERLVALWRPSPGRLLALCRPSPDCLVALRRTFPMHQMPRQRPSHMILVAFGPPKAHLPTRIVSGKNHSTERQPVARIQPWTLGTRMWLWRMEVQKGIEPALL